MTRQINQLEVVLKTVERCNLNCSYCYFFNAGDDSYKKHPPFISMETISDLATFLKNGINDLGIKTVIIDFHGGEPMLQPLADFDRMCTILKDALKDVPRYVFTMQTNGTLVTDPWIDLISKHKVVVGVSCDGLKENHDKFRVDHKGRGSYDQMVQGLKKLQKAHGEGRCEKPATLCVINPDLDGREVYHHFTRELDVKLMDFLFPNVTYETSKEDPEKYGRFLCELFDAWTIDDNPKIKIRILESTLRLICGQNSILSTSGPLISDYEEITISSKGDVGPDDALRSANPSFLSINRNIKNTSLIDLLKLPSFRIFEEATSNLPKQCTECMWQQICKGGHILHRYSHENQFHNPSLMCSGLKKFYQRLTEYALSNGLQKEVLQKVLNF
jgi:uncharacterized protein